MSSTKRHVGAGLWMLHPGGARLGRRQGAYAMPFDAPFRLGPFTVIPRGPPFALRAGQDTGVPVPLARPRRACPTRPGEPPGWPAGPAIYPGPCSEYRHRFGRNAAASQFHPAPLAAAVCAARLAGVASGRPSRVAGSRDPDRTADHRGGSDHRDHAFPAGPGAHFWICWTRRDCLGLTQADRDSREAHRRGQAAAPVSLEGIHPLIMMMAVSSHRP